MYFFARLLRTEAYLCERVLILYTKIWIPTNDQIRSTEMSSDCVDGMSHLPGTIDNQHQKNSISHFEKHIM